MVFLAADYVWSCIVSFSRSFILSEAATLLTFNTKHRNTLHYPRKTEATFSSVAFVSYFTALVFVLTISNCRGEQRAQDTQIFSKEHTFFRQFVISTSLSSVGYCRGCDEWSLLVLKTLTMSSKYGGADFQLTEKVITFTAI